MRRCWAGLGLALLLPVAVAAEDAGLYPASPVRLIAAAAPGGNPDVLARLLSQKLSEAFGKPLIVENVPGAGGEVAAKMVAAAPPDGHVLMLGDSGALAISVAINPDIPYSPFAISRPSPHWRPFRPSSLSILRCRRGHCRNLWRWRAQSRAR
jgi:tripartite-type tricarboxylate transporter receptor subunit TctC